MALKKEMLYYNKIHEFFVEFFKDLLTDEHLEGGQIQIQKLSFPNGEIDETANFWGYQFLKNGKKYLLSATDKTGKEINLQDKLPIIIGKTQKVASRGVAYYRIVNPISAKFTEKRSTTFKQLLNFFASLEHTNKRHQTLEWMFGFASVFGRTNYRISTPPGFGKDSTVDILGNLLGKCCTIESPTPAKLEERATVSKWLRINEVVDIAKGDWDVIQQFLLAAGAGKPKITKRSRAHGIVKEEIDISSLSISLAYNDIDCYTDMSTYLDFNSKKAVIDRFVAVRLYGKIVENFNKTNLGDDFTKIHFEDYKELLYNLAYWKSNYRNSLHGYDRSSLNSEYFKDGRDLNNINVLLDIIDCYSDNQEEFNSWVKELNRSHQDYLEMIKYPKVLNKFYNSLKLPKDKIEKFKNTYDAKACIKEEMSRIPNADRNKQYRLLVKGLSFLSDVEKYNTFIDRNIRLNSFNPEEEDIVEDVVIEW